MLADLGDLLNDFGHDASLFHNSPSQLSSCNKIKLIFQLNNCVYTKKASLIN